jgi:hypothetical protein
MSQIYLANFSMCFSCDKLQSPTPRCECGFNVDIVCEKLMRLCMHREVQVLSYLIYIIESFTLKYVKKIANKLGYVSSMSLGAAARVCAIEIAMRSQWFENNQYILMLDAAMLEVEGLSDVMREEYTSERMLVWNATIQDTRIFTPPLIGSLKREIFRSKLMFALQIQNELANGRSFRETSDIQVMLLPDHVTYTTVIRRRYSQSELRRINQVDNMREAVSASLVTLQSDRDIQMENNKVINWKNISIINNVLEKSECQDITCPICYDDIIHSKKIKTNCGHIVCSDCVSNVITKCGSKCIMCRAKITSLEFGSVEEMVKCQNNKIQILS